MATKKEKKDIKVRDLKPRKDAKGGAGFTGGGKGFTGGGKGFTGGGKGYG